MSCIESPFASHFRLLKTHQRWLIQISQRCLSFCPSSNFSDKFTSHVFVSKYFRWISLSFYICWRQNEKWSKTQVCLLLEVCCVCWLGFSFICPFLLAAVIIEFSLLWQWRQAEWEKNPELWMVIGKLPSESKEILQELTIRSNFWPGPRPLRIYRWTVKWWVIISLYSYALFHLLIVSIRQPQLWPRGYCWI